MVLGVSWLSTLGPIMWHFSQITMKFELETKQICLKGLREEGLIMDDKEKFLLQSMLDGRGLLLQLMAEIPESKHVYCMRIFGNY